MSMHNSSGRTRFSEPGCTWCNRCTPWLLVLDRKYTKVHRPEWTGLCGAEHQMTPLVPSYVLKTRDLVTVVTHRRLQVGWFHLGYFPPWFSPSTWCNRCTPGPGVHQPVYVKRVLLLLYPPMFKVGNQRVHECAVECASLFWNWLCNCVLCNA